MPFKTSFSTLGCPNWSVAHALDEARRLGFNGVELRYIDGSDALWDLPELNASGLAETRRRAGDRGIAISGVAARAHFHFADAAKRKQQIDEAKRNVDIAAALDCRGVRILGNKVQPGQTRKSTMKWISGCAPEHAPRKPRGFHALDRRAGHSTRLRLHGAAATWRTPPMPTAGCGGRSRYRSREPLGGLPLSTCISKNTKNLSRRGGQRDIQFLGQGEKKCGGRRFWAP